jgi:MYXO-CTERM domain-containing protein
MDCQDGDPCTADRCDPGSHTCTHGAVPGCCTEDAACDDGDACTADRCDAANHVCRHPALCCENSAECDDGDSCTIDACIEGTCAHDADPACAADAGLREDGGVIDDAAPGAGDAGAADGAVADAAVRSDAPVAVASDSGCGCRTAPGHAGLGALAAGLLLLGLRARRRR